MFALRLQKKRTYTIGFGAARLSCQVVEFIAEVRELSHMPAAFVNPSDLQHVAFAGHHAIKHGIDEEAQEEPGNQSSDDHDRERPLRVGADSS
jgi:hypothetical protein